MWHKGWPGQRWRAPLLASLVLLLLCLHQGAAGATEQFFGIPSRAGVVVPVLALRRDSPVAQVVVALGGGSGRRGLRGLPLDDLPDDPESSMGAWRRLAERVGAVVLVDTPDDHPVLDLADRRGQDHEDDIGAVLRNVRIRYPGARVVLFGYSNGAYSAAILATSLAPLIDAVILVNGNSDAWGRLTHVTQPVLGVHHRRDACLPFKDSYAKAKFFPLIVVDDVRQPAYSPYAGRDCGPTSAHALYGMRARTFGAIGDWLLDGVVREKVD